MEVIAYVSDKAWTGTTLFADNHSPGRPRIVEVNMLGEILWEYLIPEDLSQYNNPGLDVESLPDGNVLFLLPRNGVYEIDRDGNTVWSYLDPKVSHDADRLPNGNTLVVWGGGDTKDDPQVREISPSGETVWAWYARDQYGDSSYADIEVDGWTHTNAVTRLPNGNTLISLRNFHFIVEVDPEGTVVDTIGEGRLHEQHDPEILDNGNVLVANHSRNDHFAVELDPETGLVVWTSRSVSMRDARPLRDADRLPNGNTLLTGSTRIVEMTRTGEVVWELVLKDQTYVGPDSASLGFYKSERIATH